jgi:hypothetical protein
LSSEQRLAIATKAVSARHLEPAQNAVVLFTVERRPTPPSPCKCREPYRRLPGVEADFSNGGECGELGVDFQEWRRGLTYTVRPELLRPLPLNREVRLNVTVRRFASITEAPPSFARLYERATAILEARIATLRCDDTTAVLRTWILAQAWFANEFGVKRVCSASITSAALFRDDEAPVPMGEPRPDATALRGPSGGTPAAFEAKHLSPGGAKRLDEMYVDFAESDPGQDVTVSYGGYVPTCDAVDYAPIVEQATMLARFYHRTLSVPERKTKLPFEILRREWRCLATNKTVDSAIATVHIYFRL